MLRRVYMYMKRLWKVGLQQEDLNASLFVPNSGHMAATAWKALVANRASMFTPLTVMTTSLSLAG